MIAAPGPRPERGKSATRRSPTTCETSNDKTSLGLRYRSNCTGTARAVRACSSGPLASSVATSSAASQGG
eukprot:4364564-Pyramimonas_sp.AAC.1